MGIKPLLLWKRSKLQNLPDYGDKKYLALQSFARSKAGAEGKVSGWFFLADAR